MIKISDFYFTGQGDITLSSTGDIGVTENPWRDDSQQAYIRVMTDPGDFVLYPELGASMTKLYGMPQSEHTAQVGKELIRNALEREGRFTGRTIDITAVPTGPQTVRFDIYIISGSRERLVLSIQQDLGVN